jgi:uncharacterized damage-inducible protein DinB
MMSQSAVAVSPEIEVLRNSAQFVDFGVKVNLEGISHADSLVQPKAGGNCLNWVLGHLACVYNNSLALVGEQPVRDTAVLARYDRGSKPIVSKDEALELSELLAIWNEAAQRFQKGLESLSKSRLDEAAPFSPTNNPKETVRSLLTTIFFHQAYHAGQLGMLRRIAGKNGAIA